MGCDIHLIVQVRQPNGEWETKEISRVCDTCHGSGEIEKTVNFRQPDGTFREKNPDGTPKMVKCYWCDGSGRMKGYRQRNYDLFAILANVRNGIESYSWRKDNPPTGRLFTPIAMPKGLPDDLIERRKAQRERDIAEKGAYVGFSSRYDDDMETYVDGEWLGDHSVSWLTLSELLLFDWEAKAEKQFMISMPQYLEARKDPENWTPNSYSGGVGGGGIITLNSVEEAEALIAEKGEGFFNENPYSYYLPYRWGETYRDGAGDFYSEFIPKLQELGLPQDVRIVFGFDN